MALKEILTPLQEIHGYLASLIFNLQGDILVLHTSQDYAVAGVGENMVAIMTATLSAVNGTCLGDCQFIQINSEFGIVGAVWIEQNKTAVAVLLEPKSNMGLAKLALLDIAESASSTESDG